MNGKLVKSNHSAITHFHREVSRQGLDINSVWVGGYVDYEWNHLRHILNAYYGNITDQKILELGCNLGGSSIVMAHMGAEVTAIDVNFDYIKLAKLNSAQYDCTKQIQFNFIEDTQNLPYADQEFDMVLANSVMEYIPRDILSNVLCEIDRVLKNGGDLQILGTSSKLCPKEVHDGRWFINYIPRFMDKWLYSGNSIQRGLWPWAPMQILPTYINFDLLNNSYAYFKARKNMGKNINHLKYLKVLNRILKPFGQSIGLFGASFSVCLRKPN